jgi:hypothetical protein
MNDDSLDDSSGTA